MIDDLLAKSKSLDWVLSQLGVVVLKPTELGHKPGAVGPKTLQSGQSQAQSQVEKQ